MKAYLAILRKAYYKGYLVQNRTGIPARQLVAPQFRWDLRKGFPLLTTKRLHIKSIIGELLWIISGGSNIKPLNTKGITIWDEWAGEDGELGPVYGAQWRGWVANDGRIIDQLQQLVQRINKSPNDRRLIISAWNVGELEKMALPPCHMVFQIVTEGNLMHMHVLMRSCDIFFGLPFNIAEYALLLEMLCHVCRTPDGNPYTAADLVITMVNAHLYENLRPQARKQLKRKPTALPQLRIKRQVTDITQFTDDDFDFVGYNPQSGIKGPIAV